MRHALHAAALVALAGSVASAQTLWNNAAGGLWTTPGNWSPADVPNSSGELARIMLPGNYTVELTGGVGVGGVELFNSGATLQVSPGASLSVLSGGLVNEGLVLINHTGAATNAVLTVTVDTTLTGSGVVRLNGAGLSARLESQVGATLTIASPQQIRGRGRLLGVMQNDSEIIGDSALGPLEIASNLTQGAGGACIADAGQIGLQSGVVITGGFLRTLNGGDWRTQTGSSHLDGVTNEGDGFVVPGTQLRIQAGGLVNNGLIIVNETGASSDASLHILATATLSGTGEVRLNGTSLDAQLTTQVGATLTSESRIAGRGRLSATMVNEGVVAADVAGQVLEVNGVISQTAAGVCRADEGTLGLINGGSISGGTLETSGDGRWRGISGTSSLEGVTNLGLGEVAPGAIVQLLDEGMTNHGLIVVNHTGSATDAAFRTAESAVLDGTGTLRLNGAALDAQVTSNPGATLENGPDHSIAGRGRVLATVLNRGQLLADSAPGELEVSGTITQTPTARCMGDGAAVGLVNGGSIIGGTFDSANGGRVQASSGLSTISGVTNLGDMGVAPGATLQVDAGGLVNHGVCTVNLTGSSSDAVMRFIASAPLGGTGRFVLNGAVLDAQLTSDPGVIITHGASHTIGGRGRVSATVSNNGTFDGDAAIGVLEIAGAISQSATGRIHASVGTLGLVAGGSVSGGLIDGTGAGSVGASSGTSTIRDTRINGTFDVRPGATVQVAGVITNDGTIRVNPAGSPSDGVMTSLEPVMFTGAGEIVLIGSVADARLDAAAMAPITLGPDQVLRGIGRISGEIHVEGAIAPGLSAGSLNSVADLTFADDARLEIEVASTSSFDRITGTGTYTLDGSVVVSHLAGFMPVLGNRLIIVEGTSFAGRFADLVAPDLGGIEWKLVYFPTKVELQVRCKADLSGSSDPNDPNYGIPDGLNDASDFFYYLDLFVANDSRADLTGSSDPNDPSYGIKDGIVDASDFFFFLDIFVSACG